MNSSITIKRRYNDHANHFHSLHFSPHAIVVIQPVKWKQFTFNYWQQIHCKYLHFLKKLLMQCFALL